MMKITLLENNYYHRKNYKRWSSKIEKKMTLGEHLTTDRSILVHRITTFQGKGTRHRLNLERDTKNKVIGLEQGRGGQALSCHGNKLKIPQKSSVMSIFNKLSVFDTKDNSLIIYKNGFFFMIIYGLGSW